MKTTLQISIVVVLALTSLQVWASSADNDPYFRSRLNIRYSIKSDIGFVAAASHFRMGRKPKLPQLMFASALIPGAGLAQLERNNVYYAFGGAAYTTLVGSAFFLFKSNQTYNDYLNSWEAEDRNTLHNKALSQRKTANVLAATSAGIWTANFVYLWVRWNKKNNRRKKTSFNAAKQPAWMLVSTYNAKAHTPELGVRFSF